jgi:Ni,Fe-hydrogenase maturation factor
VVRGAAIVTPGAPGAVASGGTVERGILVIGYGNTLRRDDGAGVRAAEMMAVDPRFAAVEVLMVYQLTPELSLDIATASLVVFIDADVRGLPGSIEVRELGAGAPAGTSPATAPASSAAAPASPATAAAGTTPVSVPALDEASARSVAEASALPDRERADPGASSHHVGADELLALARELWGATPRALAVGIGVSDFELGEGLAAPVEAALPRVLDLVARRIADHRPG